MSNEKSIQLPIKFFINVIMLLNSLDLSQFDNKTQDIILYLQTEIDSKIERMERHKLYTDYKSKKLTEAEREQARQNYLKKAGIHKDWQY